MEKTLQLKHNVNMKSILCIDDDLICLKSTKAVLESEYRIFACGNIEEAKKILLSDLKFELILLDRGLPDGDGMLICNFIKEHKELSEIPIIFLSAAASEPDKIMAFYAGADDYVTKPFSLLELKARIHARLKVKNQKIILGNLEVELESHRAFKAIGSTYTEIDLTRTEFKILVTLIKNVGNLYSREMLLDKVWGNETHVADRVIDSHVSHLRKKIADTGVQISSLRGEGYKLTLDPSFKIKSKAG